MAKDTRYNTVKILIEGGHITACRQIFTHIPKTLVATDMGINFYRFNKIIDNVDTLTVKELFILSGFFGVDGKIMFDIIYNQHNSGKPKRKK